MKQFKNIKSAQFSAFLFSFAKLRRSRNSTSLTFLNCFPRLGFGIFCAILMFTAPLVAQTNSRIVETGPMGTIDWGQNTITAKAANFSKALKSLRVDAGTTLGEMLKVDSGFEDTLQAIIVPQLPTDNTALVTLPLYGPNSVGAAIFDQMVDPEWRPYAYQETDPKDFPTGLIVDASGTDFYPCITPNFEDEAGGVFFDSGNPSPTLLQKQGLVTYATDLEKAKLSNYVADTPLVVKALKTSGPFKGNLVFDAETSAQLRTLEKRGGLLDSARIIIILPQ